MIFKAYFRLAQIPYIDGCIRNSPFDEEFGQETYCYQFSVSKVKCDTTQIYYNSAAASEVTLVAQKPAKTFLYGPASCDDKTIIYPCWKYKVGR